MRSRAMTTDVSATVQLKTKTPPRAGPPAEKKLTYVDWLWREPLPSPLEAIQLLTEILGNDPGAVASSALVEAA